MPDHVQRNRSWWNTRSDEYQAAHGPQLSTTEPGWGPWQAPERELRILGEVAGLDVLELGCGGAQWSIALARQGARCVGIDISSGQLAHARRLVAEAGVPVELHEADAEHLPLADLSFDVVFCDHGATTFTDPYRTIPEVARVLRPGGRFAFNMTSPIVDLCWDEQTDALTERLVANYFDMHRFDLGEQVSFQLPYGEWIRLFRRNRLAIDDLVELRPTLDATTTYTDYVTHDWARRWPAENIWKLHKERD